MGNYEILMNAALETLKNDDDIFTMAVDEIDAWNGYADGFRAFDMDCLDDFYSGVSATKLLEDITKDFNISDYYFYYSIYGLESTSDKVALYRDHADEGEVLDNLIDCFNHINLDCFDRDFAEIVEALADYDEETAADLIEEMALNETTKAAA